MQSQFELLRADIAATRADLGAEIGAIALFGSQVAILAVLLAQSL